MCRRSIAAASTPSKSSIDRIAVDPKARSRIAGSIETALDLGRGAIYVARVDDSLPDEEWIVDRYSLHFACHQCGRSFEELTPNSFSFNSPLGWCPSCEGLGTEQGTNLTALIADAKRPLSAGAIAAWPNPEQNPLFAKMLDAWARQFKIPLDVPFERLEPTQQRLVLHGTGDRWITVGKKSDWKFQYKGLFPAIEESSRVSYAYRQKLHELVGEVPCSWCGGSRLRADAAAVRFLDRTIHQLCSLPLDETLAFLKGIPLSAAQKKVAGDLVNEATSRLGFLVDVGLDYLTLARPLPTLSGGETQRIRLAGQIGRALTGVLYVLDEPTIGLHPRDNDRLLEALRRLRDLGNTVVMVEHDREVIRPPTGSTISARVPVALAERSPRKERRRPSRGRPHRSPDNIFRAAKKSRFRQAAASRPTPTFRRAAAGSSCKERGCNNLRRCRPPDSARYVHLRDGRVGLGQEFADRGHAGTGRRRRNSIAQAKRPARTTT